MTEILCFKLDEVQDRDLRRLADALGISPEDYAREAVLAQLHADLALGEAHRVLLEDRLALRRRRLEVLRKVEADTERRLEVWRRRRAGDSPANPEGGGR